MGDKPKRTKKKEDESPDELKVGEKKPEKDKSGITGNCQNGRCHTCKQGGLMRVGSDLRTYRCAHECHGVVRQ